MAKKTTYGPQINYQQRLAGRQNSFSTQVDNFVVNTEEKMLALMRDALHATVQAMQVPVMKGGRMRVDTGFLRSSGQANIGGLPSGPTSNPAKTPHSWDSGNLELTLAQMKFGDSFFWGWTANYAKYREAYDGFMEAALQNWQNQVNSTIAKIKARFK